MRSVLKLAALGAAASLALAACGDAPDDTSGDTPTTADSGPDSTAEETDDTEGTAGGDVSDFQACMVSDSGGFDDQSFNQSGKEGLDAIAEELGIETTEVESQSDADYATNVGNLVTQGCDLTIGVGFLLEDAIQQAAEQNPDSNFALIDSGFSDENFAPVEIDNAKPLLFNTAEASFLAGYLAAGVSESGTVATFGGLQIPSVAIFMDGFADGVAKYNEDNGTDVKVLGWDKEAQTGSFSGDFENQSQGQTLTEQFLAQGADVIMPVAGPVGLGAAAAVSEADGAKLIWVDSDGYLTASEYGEYMLTSVMKGIGAAVQDTVREAANGNFTNEPYVGTLENEGVGLAPFHDFESEVPQELVDKIEEYKQQIISGELVIETPNAP
ncbi:BMP family ABC transporter substrate-binding protein [Ornithinimicrobium humiphilum]|uniref:Nucleoside-binding protein n=1 Tax=Ornithinimicrobium humiphilum TaxID=125288 RepID=A0A543KQT0_9MICO|nr:BMP family ABC transporter substrate-binding protein [Ornithinimicrobium humiphilum]TQM97433.1 nucleoside-binding protein [Ornithinimicrobium humiphilum]